MMRSLTVAVLAAFVCVATGFAADEAAPAATAAAEKAVEKAAPAAKAEVKAPEYFVCEKCCTMAMKAGKCPKCEGEMKSMHLLGVKDGKASFCSCGADCKCTVKEGETKCGCGKDVKVVDLKGMFVCTSGKCPMISDKAGKCVCGKDLVEVK